MPSTTIGSIGWVDLTVPDAERVKQFYAAVVGWAPEPVDMGGYADFNMTSPSNGQPMAGVCHRRGVNADLPAQWLIYIDVPDLDASMSRAVELGGRILAGPKGFGGQGRYCVIEDPAGAVAALFQRAG
jgi:hypothetical protein